ncbi:hypothetical protein B9Z65_857 [Elsinoe australis]|uniref:Xylanolytic transcriptional activator regulatory domain-containing protein n=1 Tax=Elsinoe australis TaxID=40998 RepID=A0A2P8AJS7_9PEZI|nr:hypothetical protein B9Z65_857 [Elsinoe australis]
MRTNPLDDELGNYFDEQTPATLPEDGHGNVSSIASPDRSDVSNDLIKSLPTKETAEMLVTAYFRSWHPFLPFLHGPTFMSDLEAVYEQSITDSWRSICCALTLQCVLRIAAVDYRDTIRLRPSAVDRPQTLLAILGPLALDNRQVSVQALLAAQMYLVVSLSLDAASSVGGLICRSIVKSGLHRCPYRYPNIAEDDRDMRKRTFWCAYILDRFLTQSMGHPLGLQDGDIDVCLPSPDERHAKHAEEDADGDRLRVLSNMIKCAKFTGQILETFHKSIHARSLNQHTLLGLEAEIEAWWNQLPRRFNETTSFSQRAFFNISYNHLKLLMNRPFLSLDPFSPNFLAAIQKCLSASRNIIEIFSTQLSAADDLKWPGYMSCAWMAGLLVVFAAQCNQYPVEHAKEDVGCCLGILNNMSRRWKAASHCRNALRILKDRIDQHPPGVSPPPEIDTQSPDLTEFLSGKETASTTSGLSRSKRRRTTSQARVSGGNSESRAFQEDFITANEAEKSTERTTAPEFGGMEPPFHANQYNFSTDMFQSTDWESLLQLVDQDPLLPGFPGNFE